MSPALGILDLGLLHFEPGDGWPSILMTYGDLVLLGRVRDETEYGMALRWTRRVERLIVMGLVEMEDYPPTRKSSKNLLFPGVHYYGRVTGRGFWFLDQTIAGIGRFPVTVEAVLAVQVVSLFGLMKVMIEGWDQSDG